ncbi:hypothetical protein AAKU55_004266 [Oxalobacteraceae bacterium GrIS 1.11]
MIRLFYLSHATSAMSDEQVQEILAAAHRNNARAGVTGVLVHMGGLFAQILEGPEQAVLRLYVKIMEDPRHSDCRIIHISPANERMFQKWSMGFIRSAPLEFQKIMDLKARRQEVVSAKVFTDAMSGFVRQLHAGELVPAPT